MRTLDLDTLEIFRAVVQEGGVIRAARKLNRVQSNVTTRIKQLEQRLEVRLFRRQGRGLQPTAAGQTLLAHADRLLRLAAEAEAAVRGQQLASALLLGALESTAASRLPPVLARFNQLHPEATLTLRTGTTDDLIEQVRAFRLDAALVAQPFDASGLQTQPIVAEELVLVGARDQVPAAGRLALHAPTVLAFPEGCAYRRRLGAWLNHQGIVPAKWVALSSYHAIMACAAGGMGIAVVPRSLLGTLRDTHFVGVRPLPARWRTSQTHLVWRGEPHPLLHRLAALLTPRPGAKAS